MKISHNWLKEYVPHELSPQELADLLTMAGLEVEDVEPIGSPLDGVVVGHVLDVRQHPNADRLSVCRVDLGDGEPVQIVCGAPNVAAGQKVPVATVGTTLLLPGRDDPADKVRLTIKKAKLRGETSEGMICAEDELGLSEDHGGIMVLHEDAPTGQPFEAYLRARGVDVQDAVLDVSITPNRPDAVSHLGVARDVAALTNTLLAPPEVALPEPGGEAATQLTVEIEAPLACPRYAGLLVRGVTVRESPAWLKQRLTAVGLRPRNNIVDVTNYVMYECGQPLHAFDFDRVAGAKIVVRLTAREETFTTLDTRARTLPAGTLMICDAERPVAVAGVMGGENSEVTEATTNVLIESAYFDPSTIRRAAKALGLSTDASYRFERGVDRDGQLWAAARAAQLIAALGGGTLVPGAVDAHPVPPERREVLLRPSRVAALLGTEVPVETITDLLTAIGFEVEPEYPLDVITEQALEGRLPDESPLPPGAAEEMRLRCVVPTFRPDVSREVDVIEEVARLNGYDAIPEPTHSALPNVTPRELPNDTLRRHARALLSGLGYREIYTNSMLPAKVAGAFAEAFASPDGGAVETLNPISSEMAALRPSLLPGLLQVASFNQKHGQRTLRFMEFGHVFRRTERDGTIVRGYAEHESFIVGLSGPRTEAGWDNPERTADFFDLKGDVGALLEALRLPDVAMRPVYDSGPAADYHVEVSSGDVLLGRIARLSDALADDYDLRAPLYYAELNWQALVTLAAPRLARTFRPVSRFPVVERDVAVTVARAQPVGPMLDTIREAGGALLRHTGVFDLYEGERIEAGRKSIAFSLRFGADRTLQDEEVDAQVARVVAALGSAHGAVLRS